MAEAKAARAAAELVRERYSRDCFLVGFTTHRGSVTASSDWDEPPETYPSGF